MIKKLIAAAAALSMTASAYASDYLREKVTEPQVGSVGGEWTVFALARGGADITDSYFDDYYNRVVEYTVQRGGVLDERKNTEYSRAVLALTAIGRDPRDVGGYDLVAPLADYNQTVAQGTNGAVYALIALDCGGYDAPDVREKYVDKILSSMLENGAVENAPGGGANVDVTAMSLAALSNYTHIEGVSEAMERSLEYISSVQEEDGGFSESGVKCAESAAQVLTALSVLRIPETDARFVKNGRTVLDNLMSYETDSGFSHIPGGKADLMATEQAAYALAAHNRAAEGKCGIFDMSDVEKRTSIPSEVSAKHPDVRTVPVIYEGISFSDISVSAEAIIDLASRGIINGRAEGIFAPEDSMTRAEFAAIMVRGLGLPLKRSGRFADVRESDWFGSYVDTAADYGIVNGISETEFAPGGTITREQAAVMSARAAALCGMDTNPKSEFNTLEQFGDYRSLADWARSAAAFCYESGIFAQPDINIEPSRAIKRYEVAQIIYNIMRKMK